MKWAQKRSPRRHRDRRRSLSPAAPGVDAGGLDVATVVKGFRPFFAGLAGFRFSFMLIAPASLKDPDVLSCAVASAMYAATHSFTCLPFRPVDSPTDAYAPVAVIAVDFARVAFIAFIAFIVFIGRAIVQKTLTEEHSRKAAR